MSDFVSLSHGQFLKKLVRQQISEALKMSGLLIDLLSAETSGNCTEIKVGLGNETVIITIDVQTIQYPPEPED